MSILKSRDLSPVALPAAADVVTFLTASHRAYAHRSEPDLTHPETFGSPGGESNRDIVGNSLIAWWLFGDRASLDTAIATGSWLIDVHTQWDHAHCHRNKWFGALALAAREVGQPESLVGKFFGGFTAWFNWLAADKYVNGNLVGLTLRPTRVLFEAIVVADMARKMVEAGVIQVSELNVLPSKLSGMAFATLDTWANRRWDPISNHTWGWTSPVGQWNPSLGINMFPFLDGRDPIAMARQTTWFHAGHITPTGLMLVREVAPTLWANSALPDRSRSMAQHAAHFGYDPITGLSLKSIGYKDGSATKGCYAPNFQKEEFRDWPEAERRDRGEHEYDLCPMLLAMAAPVERRIHACQECLSHGSKGLSQGEVSIGILKATAVAKKAGLLKPAA